MYAARDPQSVSAKLAQHPDVDASNLAPGRGQPSVECPAGPGSELSERRGALDSIDWPTTVTNPESLHNPDWWDRYQPEWEARTQDVYDRWRARRDLMRARGDRERAEYASSRCAALAVPVQERIAACPGQVIVVTCGCGTQRMRTGCRQKWLCDYCRGVYYRKTRKRVLDSAMRWSRARKKAHPAGQFRKARWRLLTLTVRHSGDLASDERRITLGWKRFRQWMHKRMGQFPFVLTWEVTPGRKHDGHLHAHVLALVPDFPYGDARDEWKRATDEWGTNLDIKMVRRYSWTGRDGVKRKSSQAHNVAHYVAKYATKGVEVASISPELAARILASKYNKRVVSASQGFWKRQPHECKRCHATWRVDDVPASLSKSLARSDASVVAYWEGLVARVYGRQGIPPGTIEDPWVMTLDYS